MPQQSALAPRKTTSQTCDQHRLLVHPTPADRRKRVDYFGNQVDYFSIHEAHRELTVSAVSRIEVAAPPPPDAAATPAWDRVATELTADRGAACIDAYQFAFDSQRVTPRGVFGRLREEVVRGRPARLGSGARVDDAHPCRLRLRPAATTVHSR